MKYRSSRGSSDRRSFEDILIHCYAGDGGIYLPEVIPKLSHQDLVALSGCAYVELCQRILKLYISDEEYKELQINGKTKNPNVLYFCQISSPSFCTLQNKFAMFPVCCVLLHFYLFITG